MDNKDLYKKAIDEIHAPENLKKKTLNQINYKNKSSVYMRYLAACAVFVLAVTFGIHYVSENEVDKPIELESQGQIAKIDLPTFKDIDELKAVLKEHNSGYRGTTKGWYFDTADYIGVAESAVNSEQDLAINSYNSAKEAEELAQDYSTTNIQVEGVDEADIIKTDGKYIYYVTYNILHIIDADTLEEVQTINYRNDENLTESFSPAEFYLVKDKLVVVGNYYSYKVEKNSFVYDIMEDIAISNSSNFAKAIIYDISNPTEIKVTREIKIDGSYNNSRMIGNNLYFISSKTPIYYTGIKDREILPCYQDTNKEEAFVPADRIVYFKDTENYNYVMIAGVDISKNEDVNIATFFGSWVDKIYASQNHLYIPITNYWSFAEANEIYKFSLKDAKVDFVAKGTFEGYLDSQFSIDEYDNYLRIATTLGYGDEATNTLYIFNENLEEVSKIEDIAKGERIYSVRFMGKVGYVVTFEQVDPLFVIDLSDPYKPEIKGELEMPGYSSYLHPYDETHIIGIGHNVKSNGYGGVTNTNMKMAMFDVSDLSNPKEMFSIDIGDAYVYSELEYNHKALFYSKTKNLIGFAYTNSSSNYRYSTNEFVLYDIDLENGFVEHGKISQELDYRTEIKRAIYIDNSLFTFGNSKFVKYDLNTFELQKELNIEEDY